ncbi:MAG: hypothetical protein ACOC3Z_01155 [Nanoarchaeota archaeon]
MVKRELVEGLKIAIERGESTEKAMMSFYNSGYSKENIEEAARLLMSEKFGEKQEKIESNYNEKDIKRKVIKKNKKTKKKVSDYNDDSDKKNKISSILIIIISIIIFIILTSIVFIIFFRKSIIDFFNNLYYLFL